jgi:hypothetical protein
MDDNSTALYDAMVMYIPYEGFSGLCAAAYTHRACMFRIRAQAIFQAECDRQKRHSDATPEQIALIDIVQRKHLTFRSSSDIRGAYIYHYLPGTKTPSTGYIVLSSDLVDRGCPVQELLLLIRHELSHTVMDTIRCGVPGNM